VGCVGWGGRALRMGMSTLRQGCAGGRGRLGMCARKQETRACLHACMCLHVCVCLDRPGGAVRALAATRMLLWMSVCFGGTERSTAPSMQPGRAMHGGHVHVSARPATAAARATGPACLTATRGEGGRHICTGRRLKGRGCALEKAVWQGARLAVASCAPGPARLTRTCT